MDKKFIFISYASTDSDKVEILKKLILSGDSFEPIIIADQRKALKPLAQKVIDGIKKSDYIIPILTNNSFKEQWINQEIGYSISESRTIIPIVQKEIIKDLKGFIHGEIDLPYKFSAGAKLIRTTNVTFSKACKLLLSDIENEIVKSIEVSLEKDPTFDRALKLKELRERHLTKESLKNSTETVKKFEHIVLTEIIIALESKIETIKKETGIGFIVNSRKDKELGIIISAEGYSVSIYWTKKDNRSVNGAVLFQKFWEGITPVFDNNQLPPSERAKILRRSERKYYPEINDNLDLIWMDKTQFTSDKIINIGLDWILRSIERKYNK